MRLKRIRRQSDQPEMQSISKRSSTAQIKEGPGKLVAEVDFNGIEARVAQRISNDQRKDCIGN